MNLLDDLNQDQKEAVTHNEGPLLIIAGAGTGKTAAITRRIAWLIDKKLADTQEILALTFTEKAAAEMEERADKLLPYGYFDLWISTFHSFCERILRSHAIDIGLPNNFKLLNTTDAWMLVRKNLASFDLDYYRPLGNPTKFIHALLKHFSRAKDECITPEEYTNFVNNIKLNKDNEVGDDETKRLGEISNAYHVYQNLLLSSNALDFGDLINYALKLFRERPQILNQYQKQFKYILVDEFQDTNIAQYELVKLLATPKNNLTVVGDDDQSIYKFRGASISNILAFQKDYPESKKIFLTKNYRSKQNLLDFSYNFIQLNNPYRLEYQLMGEQNYKYPDSNFKLQASPLSKRLIAQNGGNGLLEHLHGKNHFNEARVVADKILELKKGDDGASWNDFAILTRANDHANLFIRELADRGLPYQFLASRGLYSKPIIIDLLSYLKLLDNYHEGSAMYRVLNFPMWRLGDQHKIDLNNYTSRKSMSLYSAMKHARAIFGKENAELLDNAKPRWTETEFKEIEKILSLLEKHTADAKKWKVGRVVLASINESGYLEWLTKKDDKHRLDSLTYLNHFWKKIQKFETESEDKSIKNFINHINLEIEAGEEGGLPNIEDDGPESIKILTIHSAKGLEFKYVFIVNLVDQRFPTRDRKEAIDLPDALVKEVTPEGDIHLQEERRLFYVACTRAKDGLFLTSAEDYGGARAKKPSRFLFESGLINEKSGNWKLETGKISNDNVANNKKLLSPEPQEPEPNKPYFELPKKFSFTQIKAFETCPLQYKFAHLVKVPIRGRGTFSFGKSIHATLQKFFQTYDDRCKSAQANLFDSPNTSSINIGGNILLKQIKDIVSQEELLSLYNESFIDDWFQDEKEKNDYFSNGSTLLKALYQNVANTSPKIIGLEVPFNLKISDKTFKGVMDRVDKLEDGTIEIIDYKTGASREYDKTPKDQLLIYQLAAKTLFREPVSKLTFWYVENGSKVNFLGTEDELIKMEQKIINLIESIKTSGFGATPSEFKCKFCDFKDICEYRVL